MQCMSRFSRAYESAIKAAGISRVDVAKVADIHTVSLWRLLNDVRPLSPDIVGKLISALTNESDRRHCIREYLYDATPSDYSSDLIISFGHVEEPAATRTADSLRQALDLLEQAATSDRDLRRLVIDLAAVVARPESRSDEAYDAERAAVGKVLADSVGTPDTTPKTPSRARGRKSAGAKSE
jgi:hypothetical protein